MLLEISNIAITNKICIGSYADVFMFRSNHNPTTNGFCEAYMFYKLKTFSHQHNFCEMKHIFLGTCVNLECSLTMLH